MTNWPPQLPPDADGILTPEELPATTDGMPSAMLFRGSLVALALSTLVAVFLFVRPPESEGKGEPARATATPTRTFTATATPANGGTAVTDGSTTAPGTAVTRTATTGTQATPPPTVAANGERSYTVVAGDTLSGIAAQFGTTSDEILALNPGVTPQSLQIGQVLRIPAAQ